MEMVSWPSFLFIGHRHNAARCLIRIFTVSLHNVLLKFGEKYHTAPIEIGYGLVLLIKVGKCLRLKWVYIALYYQGNYSFRPLDKSAYTCTTIEKHFFLISQPNHMLWVLF